MNKEYKKLHAEWYDLVSDTIDHNKEINFWVRKIEEAGQPVLELGSGTGRILIPLLEKGFDITGIDTSEDMLNRCRERCKEKKLNTLLYKKSMLDFDLQCKFNMVILGSGGLGLFVDDTDINKMFERIMAHLKPGGLFIFEFQPVPEDYKNSNSTNWTGDWINGPNDVIIAWRQKNEYNAASHVWKRLFVVEKFINGHLIDIEANEKLGRFFTVDEAMQYARSAGFDAIRATNWLTEDASTNESKVITVQCRKP